MIQSCIDRFLHRWQQRLVCLFHQSEQVGEIISRNYIFQTVRRSLFYRCIICEELVVDQVVLVCHFAGSDQLQDGNLSIVAAFLKYGCQRIGDVTREGGECLHCQRDRFAVAALQQRCQCNQRIITAHESE